MTQEKIRDYTLRITMANKTQMITILYEMVLDYINEAESELSKDNRKGFIEGIQRAGNCIDELIHSLNLGYELANNLLGLYIFEKRQLLKAIAGFDTKVLVHVKGTFNSLHEAYLSLEKMDNEKSIMKNVPKVYVGLTYGKNQLTESISGDIMSRGLKA
ncbi:MAG: flagellar protein FliS [Butyrivibrio sp.]|uniref:flagellar export chaperone FliS n=1 Tax=Butyrivibrio sp. NC2002 TaxID=1410610 RepID=UPI00055C81BD|nr:flagellar protein FliS [Butyrivibrio sp. NC2002]MBE5860606.1 flagellar protein FliS [Butyrivibrio sp.]